MAQVNFDYNGRSIMVLCNKNDTMRNIFQKFALKANADINSIYFVYSGNYIVNQDLTFDQVSNYDDRIRNTMNILAIDYILMKSYKISSSPTQFIYQDKSNPNYQIYETIPTFEYQSPYQAMPIYQTNSNYQKNPILRANSSIHLNPKILKEESIYQPQEIPAFQTIQTEPTYQANTIFRTNSAYQEIPAFQTIQTETTYQENPIFQLGPTNQGSPTVQTNPTFIIDPIYQAIPTFQQNQILPKDPTTNIIPQQINYSKNQINVPKNNPQNIQQNDNQAVNQVDNNSVRIQRPQVKPYDQIYQKVVELNFKIKMIEEKVKEKSKNIEKKVKDMQNRLKIVKKEKKRFPDGIYDGEFQNNNISGLGTFEGDNGEKYEGEWLNGIRNGIGVVYKKDGKIFMGEYKDNKKNGFGSEEFLDSKYEKMYNNNCLSGFGIITYNNGIKYIGQIYNSAYNGLGKAIIKENLSFIGEFKNGYKYKGISFYPEDKGLFEANWEYNKEKNQYIVRGIYYLPDGTKEKKEEKIDLNDDEQIEREMAKYFTNIFKNLGKILDLSDL